MPTDPTREQRRQAEIQRTEEIRRLHEKELAVHIQAIQGVRAEVETKIRELQGHCERLQQTARRGQTGDGSEARFRVYCTAHTRLAGAIGQALKRAQATDRLLEAGREEQQDRERREREAAVEERVKAAVRDVFDLQLPKDNDFELLFGEGVAHAS